MTTVYVLDFIPSTEHADIASGVSTYNALAAMQAALDVVADRKVVIFPSGRICQDNRLYITRHNTVIKADGCELFHIGSNMLCSIWALDVNNWRIEGLRINGNKANRPTATTGQGEAGLYVLGCENFVLRDFESVLTYSDGITVGPSSNTAVSRSRIGLLDNVKTEANGRNGISFTGAYSIMATHCQAKGNTFSPPVSGFGFEPDYGLSNDSIMLIEAFSSYNAGHGLYCSGANNGITLIGGKFTNNSGWGVLRGGTGLSEIGAIACSSNGLGNWGA